MEENRQGQLARE